MNIAFKPKSYMVSQSFDSLYVGYDNTKATCRCQTNLKYLLAYSNTGIAS